MKRIAFVAGAAAGYVLGTRAGKQRYEQIKAKAEKVWSSDQVQDKVEGARRTVSERAPVVAEKMGAVTRSTGSGRKGKVQGVTSGTSGTGGDLDPDTIDLTSSQASADILGSATLGTGVTEDDQRTPGTGPGGDRLP